MLCICVPIRECFVYFLTLLMEAYPLDDQKKYDVVNRELARAANIVSGEGRQIIRFLCEKMMGYTEA